MSLSTHILDLERGLPAPGIKVSLWRDQVLLGTQHTDADGRCAGFIEAAAFEAGAYELVFEVADYFAKRSVSTFYATIPIAFQITDVSRHYHVPLLLSPFGYSTYRGS